MTLTNYNANLDIDTTLGGDSASDYVIPSQKAIKAYVDNNSGGSAPVWGNIQGTLSNQTDLQNALDDKADIDLSNVVGNVSASANSYFSSLALPSTQYIDVSTEYTAPANGWAYFVGASGTANGIVSLSTPSLGVSQRVANGAHNVHMFLPVLKGLTVTIYRQNNGAIAANRFYYAEGEI